MIKKFLEVGKVIAPQGIRGELRLELWCDDAHFLKRFKVLYKGAGKEFPVKLKSVRSHGDAAVIKLEGIDDRNAAENMRGVMLFCDRNDIGDIKGSLISDIMGCRVFDADTSREYGMVSDVLKTPANDVWVVVTGGREYLLPITPGCVIKADTQNEKIFIRPVKGVFSDDEN